MMNILFYNFTLLYKPDVVSIYARALFHSPYQHLNISLSPYIYMHYVYYVYIYYICYIYCVYVRIRPELSCLKAKSREALELVAQPLDRNTGRLYLPGPRVAGV